MRVSIISVSLIWVLSMCSGAVRGQYPRVPREVAKAAAEAQAEADRLSDEAWARALPIVREWERKGKPYVPWAARPEDLPQAKVPAFPGAEGGGAYSFGGRGGKVLVVTSLADAGPGSFREACEAGGRGRSCSTSRGSFG